MSDNKKPLTDERAERVLDWAREEALRLSRYDLADELLELHEDWKRLRRAVDLGALEERVTALELWIRDRENYETEQQEYL